LDEVFLVGKIKKDGQLIVLFEDVYELVPGIRKWRHRDRLGRIEMMTNGSDFMGGFRPLEATARASAQISATYRAKSILPLRLCLKVHLNVTAMREYKVGRPKCGPF